MPKSHNVRPENSTKSWVNIEEVKNWINVYSPDLTLKQKKDLRESFSTNILKKKLKTIDVFFNIESLKLQDNGNYITSYIGMKTEEKLGIEWKNKDFIILKVKIDAKNKIVIGGKNYEGFDLILSHRLNNTKEEVIQNIFKEVYGKKYKWNGIYDSIFIKM